MKELYTPQEVANILNIHVKTVRRYLRDGTIIGQKIGGNWKVTVDELKIHLNQRVPDEFDLVNQRVMTGSGKVKQCLIVEIKVNSQVEANAYATALMDVINGGSYTDCNFQYHLEHQVAKFILNGSRQYLNAMMAVIEGDVND